MTPQWVFLEAACFFDIGRVARVLLGGYGVLGHGRYLSAVRRATGSTDSGTSA